MTTAMIVEASENLGTPTIFTEIARMDQKFKDQSIGTSSIACKCLFIEAKFRC